MYRGIVPIVAGTLAAACAAVGVDDSNVDVGRTPYFRPAAGWEAVQLGTSATAASVPLGPATLSGNGLWDTVERLEDGDVVLSAMFYPAGESPAVDVSFQPRDLPLSADDAQPAGLEGQPDHIYAERLGAQVNGWKMDLLIFYGGTDPTGVRPGRTDPSAEAVATAQEQLARLVVPADSGGSDDSDVETRWSLTLGGRGGVVLWRRTMAGRPPSSLSA